MTLFKKFSLLLLAVSMTTLLTNCENEMKDDGSEMNGSARFEITDAPIDDAGVEGAFVTVSEIKVDGQTVEGFNKTTIDVLAYQNGATELLANADLEAKSYSQVTLVLDYATDADGNSPGCYIKKQGSSAKQELKSSVDEFTIKKDFEVMGNSQTNLVFDFDLRKCIKREDGTDDEYEFVTPAEMEAGIRLVAKKSAGVIKGKCSNTNSDKVVVYAYKKGEFNRNSEMKGQGASNVEFANAVTSAEIDASGNYQLHFLEEGDYELHYCAYEENNEGKFEIKGTLLVDILGSINLSSVSVNASSTTTVDVSATGILPL